MGTHDENNRRAEKERRGDAGTRRRSNRATPWARTGTKKEASKK